MDLNFCDHIFEYSKQWPKDSPYFLTKDIPQKIHDWIRVSSEKLPPTSKPLDLVFYLKEKESISLQMNYSFLEKQKKADSPLMIRNFLFIEKNSSLVWFENHVKNTENLHHIENHIFVEDSSVVYFCKLNPYSTTVQNKSSIHSRLNNKSGLFVLDINLSPSSSHIHIHNSKSESFSIVKGLSILQNREQAEQFIHHQNDGPSCYSRQFYRNVLGDRAKNKTYSKVVINAQGVDSNQTIKNLLISPYAKATTQPELEVNKDQVKATHGATTGFPNPMEIFYLNSRGLPNNIALKFIVKGWIQSIFQLCEKEDKYLSKIFKKFLEKSKKPLELIIYKKINELISTYEN